MTGVQTCALPIYPGLNFYKLATVQYRNLLIFEMEASEKKIQIHVEPSSIEEGQGARIVINDIFKNAKHIEWSVEVVDTYFNEFRMSSGGTPLLRKETLSIDCPNLGELKPGLYFVSQIIVRDENNNEITNLKKKDYGPVLFEIRTADQKGHTYEELTAKYEDILQTRD